MRRLRKPLTYLLTFNSKLNFLNSVICCRTRQKCCATARVLQYVEWHCTVCNIVSCYTPIYRKRCDDSVLSRRLDTVECACRTDRHTTRNANWHTAYAMAFPPSTVLRSPSSLTLHRRRASADTSTMSTSAFTRQAGLCLSANLAGLVFQLDLTPVTSRSASGWNEVCLQNL